MLPPKTLLVHANPWHSVDHLGRPSGHCPKVRLPTTVGHQGYVGVECVASHPGEVTVAALMSGSVDQDTCWHFSRDPVKVPDDPQHYYRKAIATGEILAGDEKTFRAVFGPASTFVPFAVALEASKREALAKWLAAHGELPEDIDPFDRPKPDGKECSMDVAERAAREGAEASKKQAAIRGPLPGAKTSSKAVKE